VEGGKSILISSSSGAVALVARATGRASFWAPVVNAHSIELLPGGRVAAAASVADSPAGNRIILFDLASRRELASDRLVSAHGLVWDDQRDVLWALGNDELRAYRLPRREDAEQRLEMAFRTKLPDSNGHDLAPVPATPLLFLSTGKHGWLFDRDTHRTVPHAALADTPNLKSYAVHPSTGRIAYVQAEGANWWAERVHFLEPPGLVHLPGERLYKARWL
jgi:hypothetical protein